MCSSEQLAYYQRGYSKVWAVKSSYANVGTKKAMEYHDLKLGPYAYSVQISVFNCCKYHFCIYARLVLLAANYERIGHYGIYHPGIAVGVTCHSA